MEGVITRNSAQKLWPHLIFKMLKVKMYTQITFADIWRCKRHKLIGIVEITQIFNGDFQSSPNIIGIVNLRRLLWVRYVAWMREIRNSYRIFMCKDLGK
jgi:hypothetical protein